MTKFSRFLIALAGVAAVWIVVAAGAPVMAQTADGRTPSDETICDAEVGKAFGFCNAYCEAMDCDSDDANASLDACLKVKGKFIEATEGRELPCETTSDPVTASCPCSVFTDGSLASKGLIEVGTAANIKRECFPKAGPLSPEDCVALFVCNYSTVFGATTIQLGTTGTDPESVVTEWTLNVQSNKCSAKVIHIADRDFPDLAIFQKRRVGDSELAWFENSPGFTQAEVDACALSVPDIITGIEVAMGELLETTFKCTDLSPPE